MGHLEAKGDRTVIGTIIAFMALALALRAMGQAEVARREVAELRDEVLDLTAYPRLDS